ncbi:MAG: hypothetical protein ABSF91_07700 [Bacteroidota bacterium]|jgi:hypothetical protein
MRVLALPECKPVSSKKNPLVLKYIARRVLFVLLVLLAGFLFNGALHNTSRDVHQASRLAQYDTVCVTFASGWNLVSLPVRVPDGRTNVVFSSAGSNAFSYQGRYARVDTLWPGLGYWLKFSSAQTICFFDTVVTTATVAVAQGWNLVGSTSFPVKVSNIIEVPGGIIASQFYGYDHGRPITFTTLQPGHGYWVKVKSNGKLILHSQSVKALK